MRRQARNVYLNMMCGTDLRRQAWGATPRRLWRRLREQPLRRLPGRIVTKLSRTVGLLW